MPGWSLLLRPSETLFRVDSDSRSPTCIAVIKRLDSWASCGILPRMNKKSELEKQLNDFSATVRSAALAALCQEFKPGGAPEGTNVNMHIHSFFSYNAEGWSPSRIAWESRQRGLRAAALCDFDVLEGLDEFLDACMTVGLRGAVGLETRAYLKAFADVDINSPGEPGVTYIMGLGFVRRPAAGSQAALTLKRFREQYDARNLAMIGKINAALPAVALDYLRDAVPLTPAGGVTERHLISAYRLRSEQVFPVRSERAAFWADVLGKPVAVVESLLDDVPALEEALRSRLAKNGGIGYEKPSESTFPPVDDFIGWVESCDAIPTMTWLDGTSAGESDPAKMLECMCVKGAVALNIIPDRNWNIKDAESKRIKVANLDAIVLEADRMGLPINIGTEMNKSGLPFADDLDGEVLSRHKATFLRGADVMTGHTLLARYANFSYTGVRARARFETVAEKNAFFAGVGRAPALTRREADALLNAGEDRAFDQLVDRGARYGTSSPPVSRTTTVLNL